MESTCRKACKLCGADSIDGAGGKIGPATAELTKDLLDLEKKLKGSVVPSVVLQADPDSVKASGRRKKARLLALR